MTSAETLPISGGACPQVPHGTTRVVHRVLLSRTTPSWSVNGGSTRSTRRRHGHEGRPGRCAHRPRRYGRRPGASTTTGHGWARKRSLPVWRWVSPTTGSASPASPFPTDSPTRSDDDGISAAVAYAWQKGSVVIAPAVNGDLPACGYPAVVERVVCVAATDHMGLPAKYSILPVTLTYLASEPLGASARTAASFLSAPPVSPLCEDDRDGVDHLPSSRDRLRRPNVMAPLAERRKPQHTWRE